jgi:Family of unknown function (DUF6011)
MNSQALETFKADHPAAYAWMTTSQSGFARSLLAGLKRYGSLTPKQPAAAEKCAVQDAERAVEKALGVDPVSTAPAITVEKIETALQSARSHGIKRPKLILDTFKFTLAPASGKNPGAIYVKQEAEYLGKIQNAKFVCSSICDSERRDRVIALAADPAAAAKAHGLKTGVCSCCGRALTDPKSVAAGIGPVCAKNYGW